MALDYIRRPRFIFLKRIILVLPAAALGTTTANANFLNHSDLLNSDTMPERSSLSPPLGSFLTRETVKSGRRSQRLHARAAQWRRSLISLGAL